MSLVGVNRLSTDLALIISKFSLELKDLISQVSQSLDVGVVKHSEPVPVEVLFKVRIAILNFI